MSEKLHAMRHSCAHVLAAAVERLYPGAKFGVGPVVDNGFYYDILTSDPISEDDLKKIEKEMQKIIKEKHEMERDEMSIDDAITFFGDRDQDFKVELLKSLKEKGTTKVNPDEAQDIDPNASTASVYKTGEFVDLCRGPHVQNVKEIGAFKLWKLAGAYWRGDEKNPQMQRVYGLCFETKDELKAYLTMLEEAKKRDHRKLSSELDLVAWSDMVGAGLPLWTPRGTLLRNILDEYVWRLRKQYGYQKVEIPHITKRDLYERSGHWEKFKDDLFRIESREGHEFAMKPMNCPHHTQIYDRNKWSYRSLPQRYANTTMCYRDEQTGELHGFSRLRAFTQDDAHVFCRESQAKDEAFKIWDIIETFYGAFGFDLKLRLSTHDPDNMDAYIGTLEQWDGYVEKMKGWLEERKAEYFVGVGEAAFYGAKIDFIATDAIGREWQVATVQVDRSMPESFDLTCVNEEGKDERIVMLHAAIMGSIERFLSIMIEHTAGTFPMWLAPEQIRIVTVSDDFAEFARELRDKLVAADLRAELDDSSEKVGKKIRNAAMMKVPWTIVVGEKEAGGGDFNVNVFGEDEDVSVPAGKIVKHALKAAKMPL